MLLLNTIMAVSWLAYTPRRTLEGKTENIKNNEILASQLLFLRMYFLLIPFVEVITLDSIFDLRQ